MYLSLNSKRSISDHTNGLSTQTTVKRVVSVTRYPHPISFYPHLPSTHLRIHPPTHLRIHSSTHFLFESYPFIVVNLTQAT